MLVTDMSPFPPGAKHAEQVHVGHFTFVWVTMELADNGEKMARVHAYTGGVYFSETTSAKATLLCFEEIMERLIRKSNIMLSAGALGQAHGTVQCARSGEGTMCAPHQTSRSGAVHSNPFINECLLEQP